MTNNARLISSKELGGIIGINTRTIQHYAKQGLIPCYRINTSYRFALGEVVAAIRVTKRTPDPSPHQPESSPDREP
jgi:predicted site-specific integrase-resolvase